MLEQLLLHVMTMVELMVSLQLEHTAVVLVRLVLEALFLSDVLFVALFFGV